MQTKFKIGQKVWLAHEYKWLYRPSDMPSYKNIKEYYDADKIAGIYINSNNEASYYLYKWDELMSETDIFSSKEECLKKAQEYKEKRTKAVESTYIKNAIQILESEGYKVIKNG